MTKENNNKIERLRVIYTNFIEHIIKVWKC